MHGSQSGGIRVVCLIPIQKCVDLAHSIRLELEITKTQIVFYRMEELNTLHHGNFVTPGR